MVLPQRTQSPQPRGWQGRGRAPGRGRGGSRSGRAVRVSGRKWSGCRPPHRTPDSSPPRPPAPQGRALETHSPPGRLRRRPCSLRAGLHAATRADHGRGCRARPDPTWAQGEPRKPDSQGAPRRQHSRPHSRPRSAHARSGRLSPLLTPGGSEAQPWGVGAGAGRDRGGDPWGLEMNGARRGQKPGCQASTWPAPGLQAGRTGLLGQPSKACGGRAGTKPPRAGPPSCPTRAGPCPGGARGRGAARASWRGAGRGGDPGARGAPRSRARSACPRTRR